MKSLRDVLNSFQINAGYQRRTKSSSQMQECFDFMSLIKRWPEIVGEKLASRTIPKNIYKNKLVVLTNHGAFSEQLSFMEDILLKKIFQKFPSLENKLTKITFIYDSRQFDQQTEMITNVKTESDIKKVLHPLSPEYKALRKKGLELLKDVDDENLKEQLISIYIQSFANQ